MSTWTQGPTVLWRMQCDPVINSVGEATSAPYVAFWHYPLSNASTGQVEWIDDGKVTFDLIKLKDTKVTAAGVTITYGQLASLNAQAAADQFALQP